MKQKKDENSLPTSGGSYIRDPDTGLPVPADDKKPAPAPEPAADNQEG